MISTCECSVAKMFYFGQLHVCTYYKLLFIVHLVVLWVKSLATPCLCRSSEVNLIKVHCTVHELKSMRSMLYNEEVLPVISDNQTFC